MTMQDVHIYIEKGSSVAYRHKEGKFSPKKMISHLKMLAVCQYVEERVRDNYAIREV